MVRKYHILTSPIPETLRLGWQHNGFGPFKHWKSTTWPLILFNYNIGPEAWVHIDNAISLGVIPGPKKPIDIDSFEWPMMEELSQLQLGVRAYDVIAQKFFVLHAYLILVFGDILAVSMLMSMKGHNRFSPCHMCKITSVAMPNSHGNTLYVPLDCSQHPSVIKSSSSIHSYNPCNLPLCSGEEMLQQGKEVMLVPNMATSDRLSRKYGIKGVPVLAELKSLSFPHSFPYDFMHLIWENCVDNLILLWTGNFKGLDEGKEQYHLDSSIWNAIVAVTAASGSTIPSAFGAHPPNFMIQKSACSAETWSFWTLFLGPVLLHKHFHRCKYYDHFIDFVKVNLYMSSIQNIR